MRISWLIFFLCVTLSSSFSLLVYGRKEMKRGESQANRHAAAGILQCIGVVLVLHKCAWLRLPEIKGLVYFSRIEPIFRRPLWWLPLFPVRFLEPLQRSHAPLGGSKSTSWTAHRLPVLGENEMQSPEHEISFPVIFFRCFASCRSLFLYTSHCINPQPSRWL